MALSSPRPSDMVTIIASAQPEGSVLTRMLTGRDRRTFTTDHDPRPLGWNVGSWIERLDQQGFHGRIVAITDNGKADDWITGEPTEWYITFEKPWNHTSMHTSIGSAKIEWMEDTLWPRVGRVIATEEASHFMLGDIVRLG